MAHLDDLKITKRIFPAARPRRKHDATAYRRAKLIAHIEEQIELVLLALHDKPLQLERKRGHDVAKVRPRLWWRVDEDGTAVTQIRYNKVPLTLAGRGTTIEVASLKKLPPAYRKVIRAVKAGELDRAIDVAVSKSKPRLR